MQCTSAAAAAEVPACMHARRTHSVCCYIMMARCRLARLTLNSAVLLLACHLVTCCLQMPSLAIIPPAEGHQWLVHRVFPSDRRAPRNAKQQLQSKLKRASLEYKTAVGNYTDECANSSCNLGRSIAADYRRTISSTIASHLIVCRSFSNVPR